MTYVTMWDIVVIKNFWKLGQVVKFCISWCSDNTILIIEQSLDLFIITQNKGIKV